MKKNLANSLEKHIGGRKFGEFSPFSILKAKFTIILFAAILILEHNFRNERCGSFTTYKLCHMI